MARCPYQGLIRHQMSGPAFSPEAESSILGESEQERKYASPAEANKIPTSSVCVYAMMQHPKRGLLLCYHSNIFPSLSPLSHHAASFGCENRLRAGQGPAPQTSTPPPPQTSIPHPPAPPLLPQTSSHYHLLKAGGKGGIPSRATQQPALAGLRLVSEAGLEIPGWGLRGRHDPTSSVTAETWIRAQQ